MTKKIYFDYAATTPIDPEVLKAMKPYFAAQFGNPSSLHSFGQEAMAAVDESREKIAKAIDSDFHEIIFTGSATEANNLALKGIVKFFDFYQKQITLQKQNNFAPAAKFSSPSARWPRFAGTKPSAPAGCSSKQFVSDFKKMNRKILPLRIIVSLIEHESILETCRDLEKNECVEVIYLPVNRQGFVDLKKLKESLNEQTILVSIMHANNEIGTIQIISAIAEIIEKFKIEKLKNSEKNNSLIFQSFNQQYPLFHTDAVQAFQFLDCNVTKLGVDLMTLSAHKIYGPKGIGALYIRNPKCEARNPKQIQNSKLKIQNVSNFDIRISDLQQLVSPIVVGGGQEFGLRSGTENVPAIVGFAKAVELAFKNREKETKRITELTNYFWKEIKKIYPAVQLNNVHIIKQIALKNIPQARQAWFPQSGIAAPRGKKILPLEQNYSVSERQFVLECLPNILNIYFPNQNSQDLLMKLDLAGIAVSSGSACSTRSTQPSRVLKAIGLNEKRIKESLRFSFGKFTTKEEINNAIKIIKKII